MPRFQSLPYTLLFKIVMRKTKVSQRKLSKYPFFLMWTHFEGSTYPDGLPCHSVLCRRPAWGCAHAQAGGATLHSGHCAGMSLSASPGGVQIHVREWMAMRDVSWFAGLVPLSEWVYLLIQTLKLLCRLVLYALLFRV